MKVTINRNYCGHHPAACEQCFGEFLRQGTIKDWPCLTGVEDDGNSELDVQVTSGKYTGHLLINDQNREEIMYNGYINYLGLPPEAFDIVPPHGDEVRRLLKEQEKES